MMTTGLSHDMGISGSIDYYLIQIKLGHAGDMGDEDLLPHVTSIESLFDSNKDTGEMTSVVAQGIVKAYPLLTNKKNRADLHRQALNPQKPNTLMFLSIQI